MSAHLVQRIGQFGRCRQPLLNSHREDQRGLLVANGPERGPDRRRCRTNPRWFERQEVTGRPASCLVDDNPTRAPRPGGLRGRDVNRTLETLQPGSMQGGDAVEGGAGAHLEDRRPPVAEFWQLTRPERQRLPTLDHPASCPYLRVHLPALPARGVQLWTRHDAALPGGEVSRLESPGLSNARLGARLTPATPVSASASSRRLRLLIHHPEDAGHPRLSPPNLCPCGEPGLTSEEVRGRPLASSDVRGLGEDGEGG